MIPLDSIIITKHIAVDVTFNVAFEIPDDANVRTDNHALYCRALFSAVDSAVDLAVFRAHRRTNAPLHRPLHAHIAHRR